MLYDRQQVLAEGGFDDAMGSISEDVELSYRLRARGYKLLFEPAAFVRHKWRERLGPWILNMMIYGMGRIWLMKKEPYFRRGLHLAPLALLLMTLVGAVSGNVLLLGVVLFYLAMTAAISLYASFRRKRPALAPLVFLVYVVTHYSYGIGELFGLTVPRGRAVLHRRRVDSRSPS